MIISGIQKLSLVDYEGKTACTVFTSGCNFKCPFCHNSGLAYGKEQELNINDILDYLSKRKTLLDAVCISGGEPTLHSDLPEFIKVIKDMGYLIKLDSNGTNPDMIKTLVENKLIDYIAMDIKNSYTNYNTISGCNVHIDNIKQSIKYVMNSGIDYEFRTTLVQEFHTTDDIIEISNMISGAKKYYLQKFKDNENCISSGLNEIPKAKALEYQKILQEKIPNTYLRGY